MGRHRAPRKTAVWPAACLAVAGAAAALPWRTVAAGDAPPTPPAPAPLRVMPMGDSIAWGTGSSDGTGWRGPLRAALAAAGRQVDFVGPQRHGPGPDPDLAGFPGWRIDDLRAATPRLMAAYRPDVVLLHIGTNDLRRGDRLDSVAERLAALLGEVRANRPAAHLVIARLTPSAEPGVARRIAWYNRRIGHLAARYRADVADMSGLDPRRELADPLHPNDAGYRRMAAAWRAALGRVPRGAGG